MPRKRSGRSSRTRRKRRSYPTPVKPPPQPTGKCVLCSRLVCPYPLQPEWVLPCYQYEVQDDYFKDTPLGRACHRCIALPDYGGPRYYKGRAKPSLKFMALKALLKKGTPLSVIMEALGGEEALLQLIDEDIRPFLLTHCNWWMVFQKDINRKLRRRKN